MEQEKDLTIRELAEVVRLNPTNLRVLAREGRLPGVYRIGGRWRFRREALVELRRGVSAEPIGA
jgi:excisionase family DNA binding protein